MSLKGVNGKGLFMGLYQRIETDMKDSLKRGDALRLSVVRMLYSAVKTFVIDKGLKEIRDEDVLQIIQRQIKQHKESITQFEKGSRGDLAEKEKSELKILESYMPEQLTEEELAKIVKEAIDETGAATKADLGKVMKAVLEKAKGRADGKTVNRLVMSMLK
jgi:uncharacterized protein YqeY